jgi:hypothetical protein
MSLEQFIEFFEDSAILHVSTPPLNCCFNCCRCSNCTSIAFFAVRTVVRGACCSMIFP